LKRVPITAVTVLLFASFFSTANDTLAEKPKSLGDRIVAFCKEHRGKRVGNGECTTLAAAALQAAGAQSRGPFNSGTGSGAGDLGREMPRPGEFNWGELFYSVERDGTKLKETGEFQAVRPGDLVQYYDVLLVGSTDIGDEYTARAKRHTAIVFGVNRQERTLRLYHQNYNGRKAVTADKMYLADLQQGRLSIFHPLPQTPRQPHDRPVPAHTSEEATP
jgi:hypothetical protein